MTTAKQRLISSVENKIDSLGMGMIDQGNVMVLESILEGLNAMNLVQCHKMEEKIIAASLSAYEFDLKYGNGTEKIKPINPLNYFQFMPDYIQEEYDTFIY
jgi:hypothetical protein